MVRPCDEDERGARSEKNAGCGHTREKKKRAATPKRRRERRNLKWKHACKRDMTEAGLKEDNTTNRAEWRNKINRYTADPR